MIVSMNGALIGEDQAVISVFDHGFLYGIGLFETFRTYRGIPFLLEEHLRRLSLSCAELGIAYTPQPQELRARIALLLNANQLTDGYIRLSVSAGAQPLGFPIGDYVHSNEIIYVKSLPERTQRMYDEGKPLQLLQLRRNTPEGPVRMKSSHYMNNILGKRELQQYPWAVDAEGLFLNASDYVAEGLVSNLFFIKRGMLCTPSIDTGILPGITRAFILDLADELDIPYEEGFYSQEWLCHAEDMFTTNSIQEMIPVRCLYDPEGTVVWTRGSTLMDPITLRLMEHYQWVVQGGSLS
ncbi:MAG: aminotransferase class IV [Paenibacillaceae bacterium]